MADFCISDFKVQIGNSADSICNLKSKNLKIESAIGCATIESFFCL